MTNEEKAELKARFVAADRKGKAAADRGDMALKALKRNLRVPDSVARLAVSSIEAGADLMARAAQVLAVVVVEISRESGEDMPLEEFKGLFARSLEEQPEDKDVAGNPRNVRRTKDLS